jgi:RNA polymerase sigma-70 factor (ECF subfamily)
VEILTAKDLLISTHRGDKDAAVRLYRSMAPRMLAYARSVLGHDAAAEDAVQQVFVGIFAIGRDEIEGVEDVLAWLIRLTRNAALNDARGRVRSKAREAARAAIGGMGGAGVRPVHSLRSDSHDELLAAVGGMPDDAKELIVLKHVAGLTFDQMALSLDENRSTVASRYRAALEMLKAAVSRPQGVHHG